jgi:hypothetical protein
MTPEMNARDAVDDFIRAVETDWIKAGQPNVILTLQLVREIQRLRALLAEARRERDE